MELAAEIQDEFLTCNICLEGYKRPKQLPCLHTFCHNCLSRYILQTVSQSGILSVPCPICRRVAVPPDPDPRKLPQGLVLLRGAEKRSGKEARRLVLKNSSANPDQVEQLRRQTEDVDPTNKKWADQFPDNFFVASLMEAVETRRGGGRRQGGSEEEGSSEDNNQTTYFLGQVSSCNKHLTRHMTHYCLLKNTGVCDLCLESAPHTNCPSTQHLDSTAAQVKATELLKKYRQEMEEVKQDAQGVRQSFGRKPRQIQMRKEEVEITVNDYFSNLRSHCAKLLLAKERDMIDTLKKITENEKEKAHDSQKECDDVVASINNTMTLFDTLTLSGVFNAMRMLGSAEEQIASLGRLTTGLDGEARTDTLRFEPPQQSLEDHVSTADLGGFVTDFGKGEMLIRNAEDLSQREAASGGALQNLESRLSQLRLCDVSGQSTVGEESGGNVDAGLGEESGGNVDAGLGEESGGNVGAGLGAVSATVFSNPRSGTSDKQPSPSSRDFEDRRTPTDCRSVGVDQSQRPSAPSLDETSVPSSNPGTLQNQTVVGEDPDLPPLPSAPPLSELSSFPEQTFAASVHNSGASVAQTEAYQKTLRKVFSCKPLMVFSGNMPNESRRGGLCGAARLDQVNRAAFVDRHNHSVKIIDLHLAQIVGYLHLGSLEPWDITFMDTRSELVITCPSARCLVFVPTTDRRLQIAGHVYTAHGYSCFAFLKGETFAGGICAPFGPPAVHVINMQGAVLREILPGTFRYPRTIFSDPMGKLIVVSDWTSNTVVLATSEGELVCTYKEAPGPKGVAVSQNTNLLYVLDGKWCRLHVLDVTGRCIGTSKVEGCRDPRMVVVVPTRSSYFPDTELPVVADGNNALHVLILSEEDPEYNPMSEV